MRCPHCSGWTEVCETRGERRRRECANGHRFTTQEVVVLDIASRDRAIADAVVLQNKTQAQVAAEFGLRSDSYVSRCVRKHYPKFNARAAGQRVRQTNQQLKGKK